MVSVAGLPWLSSTQHILRAAPVAPGARVLWPLPVPLLAVLPRGLSFNGCVERALGSGVGSFCFISSSMPAGAAGVRTVPVLSDEASPAQPSAAPPRAGGHAVLQEGRRGPGPRGIQMEGGPSQRTGFWGHRLRLRWRLQGFVLLSVLCFIRKSYFEYLLLSFLILCHKYRPPWARARPASPWARGAVVPARRTCPLAAGGKERQAEGRWRQQTGNCSNGRWAMAGRTAQRPPWPSAEAQPAPLHRIPPPGGFQGEPCLGPGKTWSRGGTGQ